MKIAIISDTHDNWENFEKIINWINKENIQLIFHCGDVCSPQMEERSKKLFSQIKFVRGNGDYDLNNSTKNMELEIGGKKIFIAHFPAEAKKAAESGKYDLVFYGHTHRAWEEKVGKCRMINPGEAAGHFYKPTFAVYDTESDLLELKILEKL